MRVIALFCLIFSALPVRAEVTVFAAASLRDALGEVNELFESKITVSYASSATLARQIAQGAPADIFISANPDWVSYLMDDPQTGLTEKADLLGNALVLVGSDTAHPTLIDDLVSHLEGRSLAIGLSTAVPAGIYARQALQSYGLWDAVQPHLVQTDNVRAALALVSLGEVDYALVYRSDAMSVSSVRVFDVLPENRHQPIVYVAARLSAGAGDATEAEAYFDLIQSKAAQQRFAEHGFVPKAYINAEGRHD